MKEDTVTNWINQLETLIKENNIPASFIFNFDETMLDPSHRRVKVISRAKRPHPFIVTATKGEHINFGLCISADGSCLRPLCILPLSNLPDLPTEVTNYFAISGQATGFINQEIFEQWVTKILIPAVEKLRQERGCPFQTALLLIDSHSSKDWAPTIQHLEDHNIKVFTFPAHSSHLLQPLDLSVNKKLKDVLREQFEPIANEPVPDRRIQLLTVSIDCLQEALSPLTVKRGFRRTGVHPFNKQAPFKPSLIKLSRSTTTSTSSKPKMTKRIQRSISNKLLTPSNTFKPPTQSFLPATTSSSTLSSSKTSLPVPSIQTQLIVPIKLV